MSNQILFKIRKSERHPIINVPAGENKNIKCMVDTGATIPVWCGSIEHLELLFPDTIDTGKKSLLRGFGGDDKGKEVPVRIIPTFRFSDGVSNITYKRFHMLIDPDREFGCDLILSYEMFKGMNYSFDNISEHDVVRLSFTSDRNTYFTGMRAESSGYLGYFYVFSEE